MLQPSESTSLWRVFNPPFLLALMPTSRETTRNLIDIVEPVLADAGYDLVDLEYRREQYGWVVRVFIDSEPDGIGFDDCQRVSRELGPVLDVADPIEHAYNLEVSSPGIARPLRTAAHFRRFAGATAKIALVNGVDGRRRFTGVVVDVIGDAGERDPQNPAYENVQIVVEVDGQRLELPLSDLDNARLVPDWDAEMARSRREHAEAKN